MQSPVFPTIWQFGDWFCNPYFSGSIVVSSSVLSLDGLICALCKVCERMKQFSVIHLARDLVYCVCIDPSHEVMIRRFSYVSFKMYKSRACVKWAHPPNKQGVLLTSSEQNRGKGNGDCTWTYLASKIGNKSLLRHQVSGKKKTAGKRKGRITCSNSSWRCDNLRWKPAFAVICGQEMKSKENQKIQKVPPWVCDACTQC